MQRVIKEHGGKGTNPTRGNNARSDFTLRRKRVGGKIERGSKVVQKQHE